MKNCRLKLLHIFVLFQKLSTPACGKPVPCCGKIPFLLPFNRTGKLSQNSIHSHPILIHIFRTHAPIFNSSFSLNIKPFLLPYSPYKHIHKRYYKLSFSLSKDLYSKICPYRPSSFSLKNGGNLLLLKTQISI